MKWSIIFIGLIIFLLLSNCSSSTTKINEITNHPRKYVDKEVSVNGAITDVFSLAIVHYFEIQDETGKIFVVTTKPLPKVGEKLKIKGQVKYFTLGTKQILAIKEL